MWKPTDLPDGSYADDNKPFADQDLVNLLPVAAEGPARSNRKLKGVPGLRAWVEVGDGPVRGLHDVEGQRYGVLGNYLYQFSIDGQTVMQLGYVPGHARVQMEHNQIASGYELAIATGSAGYIYNTVSGDYQKITDSSFSGGKSVCFIDQMFVWVDDQGRHFQPSDIADGLSYTALEEQEAEFAPDPLQTVIAAHQELLAFGKRTLQFYQSTGDPEELFADKKAGLDVGCASKDCVAILDNTVFWLTDKGTVVRLNSGTPQRISTHALESAWATCDLSKCFAFKWEDRGHAVYYITFPDGHTWGYDCATQKWHRRQSIGMNRWRINALVKWSDGWYAGAYNSGVIYKLDWDYPLEGCDELVREFTTEVVHDNGNRVFLDGLRVEFDTGKATVACSDIEPITPSIPEHDQDLFFAVTTSLNINKKSATGQTWTNLTFIGSGDYCAANSDAIVIAKTTGELYFSTNRGTSFTASATTFANCRGLVWDSTHSRFVGIRDDAGTLKFIYSNNNGGTWQAGGTIAVTSGNAISFGLGCVVVATSDGIYVSDDGGATSTRPITGNWTGLGFNGTGFLIGADTGSAYEYSTAPKTTWTVMGATTPNGALAIVGSTGYFIVGTLEAGIWRTSNNGVSLTRIVNNAYRYYSGACIGSRVVIGSGGGGTSVQYWSSDSGQTFTQIAPDLADNDICVAPA